jgi:hypothetical protein
MTWARRLAPGLVATLLFMAAALWNGYILFYYDSVDYVYLPFDWDLPVYRTAAYAVVTSVGKWTGTLWAVAVLQSAVTAYMMHETLRIFAPVMARSLLVPAAAILAVATGLPWFAGQLMPDAFTGPVVLGVLVLAFGWDHLLWRRYPVMAILIVGIGVHTSHLGLAIGLILSLGGLRLILRRRWPEFHPRLLGASVATVLAVVFVVTTHWATQGRPFLTQPTHMLWLARMVQDGTAKELLDEVCPTQAAEYRLCAFRDQFPATANDFLWHGESVILRLGGWEGLRDEAKQIFHESIRRHPWHHLQVMARLTLQQLVEFKTGDGMIDMDWLVGDTLEGYYPHEYDTFLASRQEQGISFDGINRLHVPVMALAQLALPLLLVWGWRKRDGRTFGLATAVLLALLGNAFICGALSNPNHRYQGRLTWVPVLVVVIGAARIRDARLREEPIPH